MASPCARFSGEYEMNGHRVTAAGTANRTARCWKNVKRHDAAAASTSRYEARNNPAVASRRGSPAETSRPTTQYFVAGCLYMKGTSSSGKLSCPWCWYE